MSCCGGIWELVEAALALLLFPLIYCMCFGAVPEFKKVERKKREEEEEEGEKNERGKGQTFFAYVCIGPWPASFVGAPAVTHKNTRKGRERQVRRNS